MGIDFEYIKNNIDNRKYRLIGSGSGRNVYDMENGFVIKAARNRKGLVQNKAEYQIASTNHSAIFAKIEAVSEDFHYLIMEKAERIKSLSEIWRYYNVRSFRELFQKEELHELLREYSLLPVDLRRLTSWGIIRGKPVIIDYGFTKEVSRYYTLF